MCWAGFLKVCFGDMFVGPAGVAEEDVGNGRTEVVKSCYFGYACVECCGDFVGGEHLTELFGVCGAGKCCASLF